MMINNILAIIIFLLVEKEFLLFTNQQQQTLESPIDHITSSEDRYIPKRHLFGLENENYLQINDEQTNTITNKQQEDGSWSQWWSYDGISGEFLFSKTDCIDFE